MVLQNVTEAFTKEDNKVGIPTCICSNSVKYLALGTSFGLVIVFEVGIKGHKVIGTAIKGKYSEVTAIAVSRDGRYLVYGQDNGVLNLWDLYNYA